MSYPRPTGQYSPDGRWYWDGVQWRPVVAPGPAWARPYQTPEARATAAVTLVGLACGGAGLAFVGAGLALAGELVSGTAVGTASFVVLSVAIFATVAGTVGSAIAVPMWMHRCFRNLPALGASPRTWSPAWAAGGWFIPLANLVIPYLVAGELWRRTSSDSERPGPLLPLWWGAWIAGYVLRIASNEVGPANHVAGDALAMLDEVATLAAGILLITIIRQVTGRQRARYAQLHGGGA